jgi:hypothetical protein
MAACLPTPTRPLTSKPHAAHCKTVLAGESVDQLCELAVFQPHQQPVQGAPQHLHPETNNSGVSVHDRCGTRQTVTTCMPVVKRRCMPAQGARTKSRTTVLAWQYHTCACEWTADVAGIIRCSSCSVSWSSSGRVLRAAWLLATSRCSHGHHLQTRSPKNTLHWRRDISAHMG